MDFSISAITDAGIKRRVNQDCIMARTLMTELGRACFAVLCDGMGGLQKGEIASTSVVMALSDWMYRELPQLIRDGFREDALFAQWRSVMEDMNQSILQYGENNDCRIGTTAVALLAIAGSCYLMNIGDSRAYRMDEAGLFRLTEDHSYVADRVRAGELTPEQAEHSPKRNVLTRCVGAKSGCDPDFFVDKLNAPCMYLLCSDGFRHELSNEEMYVTLFQSGDRSPEAIRAAELELIERNKQRGETDNISVITIYVS